MDAEGVDEDALTELALDAGAEDMTNEDGEFEILTAPNDYNAVSEKVTGAGYKVSEESGINMIPSMWQPVTDPGQAAGLMKLVDALDELEDVQNVYRNGDIADGVLPEE